jgi:hypothetical protein
MGINLSKQESDNVANIVNDVTNSISSNAVQLGSQTCDANQEIKLVAGETKKGKECKFTLIGDLTVDQISTSGCTFNDSFQENQQVTITNQLRSDIAQAIQQAAKQTNGYLGPGINASSQISKNSVALSNIVNNSIQSNFQNVCKQVSDNSQKQDILLCGKFIGNILSIQDSRITAMESCMSEFKNNLFDGNTILNSVQQKTDQLVTQTNEGIDSLFKWIAIIVGSIVLLTLVIGIILMLISSKESKSSTGVNQASLTQAAKLVESAGSE